ncbi:MAG: BamA/TamA family outer membrane protein, partial [Deltaproteobacteria bacterium]|nr:BamA/TamA family outer membrane protein [Deltaproteobacteria bacterium]
QRQVKKIKFEGNKSFSDSRLKDVMLSREFFFFNNAFFVEAFLEKDAKLLEAFYHEKGFLEAKVSLESLQYTRLNDRVVLTFKIEEGSQYWIKELDFVGLPEGLEDLTKDYEEKFEARPFSETWVKTLVSRVLVDLANQAYPYAQMEPKVESLGEFERRLIFQIEPGKKVTMGPLLLVGPNLTKEKTLRKHLEFKEGDDFSAEKILKSQINLRSLGAFDSLSLEALGLDSERENTPLVLKVQEKKNKVIDVEAGYNTDFGFTGEVTFNKLNLWGSGRHGNLKLQVGQERSRLELNYVEPRLFAKDLQLTTGVFAGRESRPFFRKDAVGGYASLFRQFKSSLSTFARIELSYLSLDDDPTLFANLDPFAESSQAMRLGTSLGVSFDRRDQFGDPRKGYFLGSRVKLTTEFWKRYNHYLEVDARLGHWFSPFSRLTISNALRVSKVFDLSPGTQVPADERLYLGGDATVRGFDQDALLPSGGSFSIVHNLEVVFRIFGDFQLAGFLDSGAVVKEISNFNLTTLRHSAGPSLRYRTPVGPIRLDYGFALDGAKPREKRLHFSFGYFF